MTYAHLDVAHRLAFTSWRSMLERCLSPANNAYPKYGGRGIRVCERWMDFRNFIADMGPRLPGFSLDRIDNDGNYEPGNCRWATARQQNRNTSQNVWVDGELQIDIARRVGVDSKVISRRIAAGLRGEALYLPHTRAHKKLTDLQRLEILSLAEQGHSRAAIGRMFGVSRQRIEYMVKSK